MKKNINILCAAVFFTAVTAAGIYPQEKVLKNVFKDYFLIGTAVNERQASGADNQGADLAQKHFSTITPENVLKWERVHPHPGIYSFDNPDKYVQFGIDNNMVIIGHTLVWHSQTPKWVFQDTDGKPVTREVLLDRMKDHIYTVVGRYKGKIKGWDVVNEALNEDGTLRESPWYKIIGPDFIEYAFRFAHEADPDAELYYNDYSLENEPKRNGAVALVKNLQDKGIKVSGIGTQQHIKMDWPSPGQIDSTFKAFAALGVKVMVTELDIDVLPAAVWGQSADVSQSAEMKEKLNPYKNGLPDSVQKALAERYGEIFRVYMKNKDIVDRITFWGVDDGDSWLNNWPVWGRTSYPLLFDRNGDPKPAFDAVIKAAESGTNL